MNAAPPVRAGLIGLGAIGRAVVRIVEERRADDIALVAALVRDRERSRDAGGLEIVHSLAELLARRPEVVVEVAGHEALRDHGPAVLRAGADLLALSAGALADPALLRELELAASAGGTRLRLVSGAIGGLEAIRAAALGGIDHVIHTTRKPAAALLSPDEVARLGGARELYRGPAREGVRRFPENVNVAAAVSLAGIGLDRTELRVVADPAVTRNRHEVIVEGAFGRLEVRIENVPSTDNPRTGRIVAMSVVRALLDRRERVVIG